ncbi:MAG: DNA helicase RecQ [Clostridia bacterium]|nr:DNA helicase RecQ [Clostridia bacterium]
MDREQEGCVMEPLQALRRYFGYSSFRPGQAEIIGCLLNGEDVLAVMPTGGGKSICFQLPALLQPGVTLVISPLISLMKDQVTALTENGIAAAYLNGLLTERQIDTVLRRAARGAYKLLYVAPERLETPAFLDVAKALPIDMVCVDEAHCVSQWGHDFRPAYLQIAAFLSALERRPTLCAFTATATERVRDDIVRLLGLQAPHRFVTGFDRENLFFSVLHPSDKLTALREYLDLFRQKSGIVYCATRKTVDQLTALLTKDGYRVVGYHAGMAPQERRVQQDRFIRDEVRVMVATNAFGMGIDKSNVAFVIHYDMPGDLESYYQEAGRAGRDGSPADCVLFFSAGDVVTQRYFIEHMEENEALTPQERARQQRLRLDRLGTMISYADGARCLRASILRYFGEAASDRCGRCSVCCGEILSEDVTIQCQKVLSCVARAAAVPKTVIAVLRGRCTPQVSAAGYETLSTFGILREADDEALQELITFLLSQDLLAVDDAGCLRLRPSARAVLFDGERLRRRVTARDLRHKKSVQRHAAPDPVLLQRLSVLCETLAKRNGVPPFAVFTAKTLSVMAAVQPQTAEDLAELPGVSKAKLQKYGALFLREIHRYRALDMKSKEF